MSSSLLVENNPLETTPLREQSGMRRRDRVRRLAEEMHKHEQKSITSPTSLTNIMLLAFLCVVGVVLFVLSSHPGATLSSLLRQVLPWVLVSLIGVVFGVVVWPRIARLMGLDHAYSSSVSASS